MANTDIARQLVEALGKNPQLIAQFVQHPYSTTQEATQADERLSRTDMSQVMTAMASLVTGGGAQGDALAGIAAGLLGQNGGSVHQLASTLFGGTLGAQGAPDLAGLASAAGGLLSGIAGSETTQGDAGGGPGGLAGLVGGLLGGK